MRSPVFMRYLVRYDVGLLVYDTADSDSDPATGVREVRFVLWGLAKLGTACSVYCRSTVPTGRCVSAATPSACICFDSNRDTCAGANHRRRRALAAAAPRPREPPAKPRTRAAPRPLGQPDMSPDA